MSTSDSEGPAWNKFWLSLDHETESVASGDGHSQSHSARPQRSHLASESHIRPTIERGDSVLPNESASHNGDHDSHSDMMPEVPTSAQSPEDVPFPFKFKAPSGRVHRLQVIASAGIASLLSSVTAKLGNEIDSVGGPATYEDGKLGSSGYALSYLDNEGDTVSITTDQDLLDAIVSARFSRRDKVDLFVHDPTKPPMSATVDPQPALSKPMTPPESVAREAIRERRKHVLTDEDEDEGEGEEIETPVKKRDKGKGRAVEHHPHVQAQAAPKQEQFVAGVPNELLLPGAIVTLAVVIVGVFMISRVGSGGRR